MTIKPAKITDLGLRILRAIHAHPELTTSGHIADHLGGAVTTWGVCEAIGSMRVDGLIRIDGGYQITEVGAAAAGVEYSQRTPPPPAATRGQVQLGLFGGQG